MFRDRCPGRSFVPLAHGCVKPSLLFFFFPPLLQKKIPFLVSIPQKETAVLSELSPHPRKKKDKIFWEVFDPLQVGMAGEQLRAQCSGAHGAISECVVLSCEAPHGLVTQPFHCSFHLWSSSHLLHRPELTLTSAFVRWVWKGS